MNTATKEQIKNDLANYVLKIGGQKQAELQLGVSNATISNIVNGKWDNISDTMWQSIANKLPKVEDWIIDTNTRRIKAINKIYSDAKNYAMVFGLIGKAGSGKTSPAHLFAQQDEVFVVKCSEFLNRKTFLMELLKAMGKNSAGFTVSELMDAVLEEILKCKNPIIILDEADKLTDQVLYFFISIYNATEDKCGLVMQATEHLKTRLKRNKRGYAEIRSRLGGRFVDLPENTFKELQSIISINGISDEAEQIRIANESEGDIRRIKRLVFAQRRKEAIK